MDEPWRWGYIATVTLPDGRGGAILDLRCETPGVAVSADFRELALEVARVLAHHAPRYLHREDVPEAEVEALRVRCRREALRRGIPDDDLEAYAEEMAQRQASLLSILELPMEGGTVAGVLARAGERFGSPVEVRRFYRMSLDD